ncbi:MAG: cytidylate kinase-like family protein [Oscillospiraceae bacterium]|jgi:cytidylate kinase|nr:cytidylate kinase-like family protein [Oscillospiraceae bacterium]
MADKDKQLIITIGREYGSGGHAIGEMLAEKLGIGFYDAEIIQHLSEKKGIKKETLSKYDEKPSPVLMNRSVRGYSTSLEEAVAEMQFKMIRKIAASGESFVLIGRCGETVLSKYDCLIRLFVLGDMDSRITRIMKRKRVSRKEAQKLIKTTDKRRKAYHNYYSDGKWGDSRTYDLTINSSRLGVEGTAEFLEEYIRRRTS